MYVINKETIFMTKRQCYLRTTHINTNSGLLEDSFTLCFQPSVCFLHRADVRQSVKSSLTFLISTTALPMETAVIKKRRGRWVGVNGSSNREKRERERKKEEVPSGEVIKEGASWLAWQQFKGGGSPSLPCTQMAVAGTTAKHTMPCGKTVSFIDR